MPDERMSEFKFGLDDLERAAAALEDGFERGPWGDAVAGAEQLLAGSHELLVRQTVAAVDDAPARDAPLFSRPDVLEKGPALVDRTEEAPQLASHPQALEPSVGVRKIARAREQGAGDLIGCHECHLGTRTGEPLGDTDPDRSAHRVVHEHRTLRQCPGAGLEQDGRVEHQARLIRREPGGGRSRTGRDHHRGAMRHLCIEVPSCRLGAALDRHVEPFALMEQPLDE